MTTEHERKFLLKDDSWKDGALGIYCIQGYLAEGATCLLRIRILQDKAFLTIKEKSSGISRLEYEYPVPLADAKEMLAKLAGKSLVEKRRYKVEYAGKVWEIDEFLGANKGLVLAEIELAFADEAFENPPWLAAEVTFDKRYYNAYLADNPFCFWKN